MGKWRLGPGAAVLAALLAVLAAWMSPASAAGQSTAFSADTQVSIPAGDSSFTATGDVSGSLDNAGPLIHLPEAGAKYPTITGAGYTIAILDTGVNYTHPALAGRYLGGWNFVSNTSDPMDDNGHGTHVTGIAASNDTTYTGVAPGANYVALKVLDNNGNGNFGNINLALAWVVANRTTYNIVSVNMSFGTEGIYNSPTTDTLSSNLLTLKNAGVFLAAASGNAWYTHSPDPPNIANPGVSYPAADASVVAVGDVYTKNFGKVSWGSGATNSTTAPDLIVAHADRSATMLDVLAPGAIITSCNSKWNQSGASLWTKLGGTSQASPVVAGAALLIRQAIQTEWAPGKWPTGAGWEDTILHIMQLTGTPVTDAESASDNVANLGTTFERVDVLAALDYVSAQAPEPATLALLGFGVLVALARRRRAS
jgi:subtilisin family serine protease